MKAVFVALFALVAVGSAGFVGFPAAFNYGYASPYAALGYNYGHSTFANPLTYAAAPISYAAPAPAIQSGYVAATRGSLHTAPLPEGPLAFSHHLNTAPAPGTL